MVRGIEIEPRFLMYQFSSPRIGRFFQENARGTAQKGVYLKTLATTQIHIAPLDEQRRIVAKIEELFSELDKGVESLKLAREQLKLYRQSVLKHAFEGKLTDGVGSQWEITQLGEHTEFLTSGSRGWKKFYSESGDLFIRAQNLKYDRLDLTDPAYVILPSGGTEGKRTRVFQGDVLITITGANVTKTGFVQQDLGPAYVSQHVALCRPTGTLDMKFLYWFLVSEAHGRKQLDAAAYGAGKPGLNLANIREVRLPVPLIDTQRKVVEAIEAKMSVADATAKDLDEHLSRIDALRQSILKHAFSGKLVSQDTSDEPAAALLERIKADKATKPKVTRRRMARAS